MDPKISQLLNEIVRLTEHLRQEAQETDGYVRKGDKSTALRNVDGASDELQNLVRKWQEVTNLLSR